MVAFGGEVRTNDCTPDVFVFKEDEGALFRRLYLPRVSVTETVKAYKQDSKGDYAHTFVLDPTVKDRKAKPTTRMMPIPLEWAPMFVDNPNFLGTAIQRMKDLFMSVTDDERYRLVKIFGMMTRACCATKASDGADSTLAIDWRRLKYHAKTWAWAEERWVLLRSDVGKDEDPMEQSNHKDYGELFRAEPARPSVVIPSARPNLGLQEWRPPCKAPNEGTPTIASQRPASRAAGTGSGPPGDKTGPVPGDMGGITDLLVQVLRAQADSNFTMHQSFQTTMLENIRATGTTVSTTGTIKEAKLTESKLRILQACSGEDDRSLFILSKV